MPMIDPALVPVKTGSIYPEPYASQMRGRSSLRLGDAGGLTQFGAFSETLDPGATSSQRHWHEAEDEFLYVLDGEVTVIEDDGAHVLTPGDAAAWPAGAANAHHLTNTGSRPATCLIVGTRARDDAAHYPDIDLHHARKDGLRGFSQKDGTPYPGWPKGVKNA